MGFLSRVEDRPTPSAVYNWRVWVLSFIASFASIMIGYVLCAEEQKNFARKLSDLARSLPMNLQI